MIPIKKQSEPLEFKNAKRKDVDLTYKAFSEEKDFKKAFDKLRFFLLQEQGYLCCYCQQKIKTVKDEKTGKPLMKTEHFIPKKGAEKDVTKQLDYKNLLAACLGNQDSKKKNYCDTSKGYKRLKVLPNPAEVLQRDFNNYLKYKVRERVGYVEVKPSMINNDDLKSDIKLLNLNEQNLKTRRFATWKGLWRVVYKNNKINIKRLAIILEDYDYRTVVEPSKRDFNEFCGFIIQWFEGRFKDELQKVKK